MAHTKMKGRKIMEYVKPEIEIIELKKKDVITSSIDNKPEKADVPWF